MFLKNIVLISLVFFGLMQGRAFSEPTFLDLCKNGVPESQRPTFDAIMKKLDPTGNLKCDELNFSKVTGIAINSGEHLDLTPLKLLDAEIRRVRPGNTGIFNLTLSPSKLGSTEPLSTLVDVKFLVMGAPPIANPVAFDNGLREIGALKNMKNLEVVHIENCNVKDFSPLRNLKKVRSLLVKNCGFNQISHLGTLPNLETLQILNNQNPLDLSGIENFPKIQTLKINGSEATELNLTKDFQSEVFDLNNNKISRIRGMRHLKSKEMLLSNNQIQSLKPFYESRNLKYLFVPGNPIQSIAPGIENTSLAFLDLTGTEVAKAGCPKLKGLVTVCSHSY